MTQIQLGTPSRGETRRVLRLLKSLSEDEATEFMDSLDPEERLGLGAHLYSWRHAWAREKQIPPNWDWRVWLIQSGRGFGKTRTGAEWIREQVEKFGRKRVALVGRTSADCRDVMVEGESGLLACCPPWNCPTYEPSKRRLTWPNGAIGTTYSADEPDLLRGPQHDAAWADEVASWKYPESWDNLLLGLRLGSDPRVVVTTTPKPVRVIRDLQNDERTHVTRGSTFENRANLAGAFDDVLKRYKGTSLERQEIYGELLEEAEGALWKRVFIDQGRVSKHPDLARVVVALDPAVTSTEDSDETGIVVAGVAPCYCKGGKEPELHGFLLADRSGRLSPEEWAERAVELYNEYAADTIIGEVNNGGDLIETVIRTVNKKVPYKRVVASRGKRTRAEPITALYSKGEIHHVGIHPDLEDQLCTWEPLSKQKSPDRLDATVWAFTELMISNAPEFAYA